MMIALVAGRSTQRWRQRCVSTRPLPRTSRSRPWSSTADSSPSRRKSFADVFGGDEARGGDVGEFFAEHQPSLGRYFLPRRAGRQKLAAAGSMTSIRPRFAQLAHFGETAAAPICRHCGSVLLMAWTTGRSSATASAPCGRLVEATGLVDHEEGRRSTSDSACVTPQFHRPVERIGVLRLEPGCQTDTYWA